MTNSKSVLIDLLGPIGGVVNLYRGYKAAAQEAGETEGRAAQMRTRLIEQKTTFAEQVPGLTTRYGRRTCTLTAVLQFASPSRALDGMTVMPGITVR